MTTSSAPSLLRGGALPDSPSDQARSALDGIRTQLVSLGRAVAEWKEAYTAIQHLEALDDRQLADLGIARSEISHKVRKGR